jgi:hypothetical protein
LYTFLSSPMHVTCPAHLICLDLPNDIWKVCSILYLKLTCMSNKYVVRWDYQNVSSLSDLMSLLVLQKTYITD